MNNREVGWNDNRLPLIEWRKQEKTGTVVSIDANEQFFFLTLDTGYTLRISRDLVEELHTRVVIEKL